MRRIGVMQEFPAAQKRRLRRDLAEAQSSLAGRGTHGGPTRDRARSRGRLDPVPHRRHHCRKPAGTRAGSELQASAAEAAIIAGRGSTAEALAGQAAVVQLARSSHPAAERGATRCARTRALGRSGCAATARPDARVRPVAGPRGGVAGLRARTWRPAALRCARRRGAARHRAWRRRLGVPLERGTGLRRTWPRLLRHGFPRGSASACRCSRGIARILSSQRRARR